MNSNYRLIDEIQQPAFWLTPMSVTLKHVPCGRVSIPEVLDLFCSEIIIIYIYMHIFKIQALLLDIFPYRKIQCKYTYLNFIVFIVRHQEQEEYQCIHLCEALYILQMQSVLWFKVKRTESCQALTVGKRPFFSASKLVSYMMFVISTQQIVTVRLSSPS